MSHRSLLLGWIKPSSRWINLGRSYSASPGHPQTWLSSLSSAPNSSLSRSKSQFSARCVGVFLAVSRLKFFDSVFGFRLPRPHVIGIFIWLPHGFPHWDTTLMFSLLGILASATTELPAKERFLGGRTPPLFLGWFLAFSLSGWHPHTYRGREEKV